MIWTSTWLSLEMISEKWRMVWPICEIENSMNNWLVNEKSILLFNLTLSCQQDLFIKKYPDTLHPLKITSFMKNNIFLFNFPVSTHYKIWHKTKEPSEAARSSTNNNKISNLSKQSSFDNLDPSTNMPIKDSHHRQYNLNHNPNIPKTLAITSHHKSNPKRVREKANLRNKKRKKRLVKNNKMRGFA